VSENYVLDSSAILTVIEKEAGDEQVKQILRTQSVFIPWIALTELLYITTRETGSKDAEKRYALIKNTKATILWDSNEKLMFTAARLKSHNRISFADALIAAYAIQINAILVHKDPEMEALDDKVRMEILPYKK
jgi:predicted nucleic acid-binding protein